LEAVQVKSFEWIVDDFSQTKNYLIGTKNNRSKKIAGGIIEHIINENPTTTLDKVAIVLGEENLLVPLLFVAFLCWCFEYHNGLQVKNNPAQILIAKLFKMHTNALAKKKKLCAVL
jgi:hypothetical protein